MANANLTMPAWVALDAYALVILGVILFSTLRVKGKRTVRERIFRNSIVYVMALVCGHALMSLGEQMGMVWLREAGTLFSFALNPGVLLYWMSYARTFFGERDDDSGEVSTMREQWVMGSFLLVNNIVVLTNPWTHALFYYDEQGIYHRGAFFLLRYGVFAVATILTMATLIVFRERIGRRNATWLLLTPVAPVVGALLQPHTHMLALELAGMAMSCAMLYLFVQGRVSTTDALTGLGNRRELDVRFDRLCEGAGAHPFSAMMLDIDRFKTINDVYGHGRGDEALVVVAQAMDKTFGTDATLVRLSGDEFIALCNAGTQEELDDLAGTLRSKLRDLTHSHGLPFEILVSLGYGVYDPSRFAGKDDFMASLDEMLYAEKAHKHAA
jgi:diguanylate cyclase (GGDEF)-like protein